MNNLGDKRVSRTKLGTQGSPQFVWKYVCNFFLDIAFKYLISLRPVSGIISG
jgi:hypothetical protein